MTYLVQACPFKHSDLFNTSYHLNAGTERVCRWGYLVFRFMLEKHRPVVDKMLAKLRKGDFDGYQQIVRSWGKTFDAEFEGWLKTLQ